MIAYVTDGTLDGIFCALFDCFVNRTLPLDVCADRLQLRLDMQPITVQTIPQQVERIRRAVIRYGGKRTLDKCQTAMLSGQSDKHAVIFFYLHRMLCERRDIQGMLALGEVQKFEQVLKRIWGEVHRYHGFVRFYRTAGGTYYAELQPDNDIVHLLIPHFAARYQAMPFVLHDVGRGRVAMWNGKQSAVIPCPHTPSVFLGSDEDVITQLWQAYYDSITIAERPHEKQMRGYMPARYWKFLPEKQTKPRF